jgi:hypothetical protein
LPVPAGYTGQVNFNSDTVQGEQGQFQGVGHEKRGGALPVLIEKVTHICSLLLVRVSYTIAPFQRSNLLGETPLQAPARSVFDYLSQKNLERLQSFTKQARALAKDDADSSTSTNPLFVIDTSKQDIPAHLIPPFKEELKVPVIPDIPEQVAFEALKGFIPFHLDLPKQTRYKQFLAHKSGQVKDLDMMLYAGVRLVLNLYYLHMP